MKSFVLLMGSLIVASASLLAGQDDAGKGETPSIKDVMNKLHKGGPKSPLSKLKTALAEPSPDWTAIEKSSKEFVTYGEALAKNAPPKGDKASWKKLAELYFKNAKALDHAAKDHDVAAAKTAQQHLATSCKVCHGAHKGKAK